MPFIDVQKWIQEAYVTLLKLTGSRAQDHGTSYACHKVCTSKKLGFMGSQQFPIVLSLGLQGIAGARHYVADGSAPMKYS